MLNYTIECFIPVIQNQTDNILYKLLLKENFDVNTYYHKDKDNFSLSRIEYIDIETLEEDLSLFLGQELFSLSSTATALVSNYYTINRRTLLEITYNSLLTFKNQEELFVTQEDSDPIQVRLIYRYFRKPKSIIENVAVERRIKLLKYNPTYVINTTKLKTYEYNNLLITILNKATLKKEVYFLQEDNRKALLL